MKINSLTNFLPKFLTNYLYRSGVFFHILLIVALLTPTLIFKEPLGFFLERTANHLNHSGSSSKQRYLGKVLLEYLPINDWNKKQIDQSSLLTSLHNWQGQGASIKNLFSNQRYINETPVQPSIGPYSIDESKTKLVYTSQELIHAIKHIKAGYTIQLMSGEYNIRQRYISITKQGYKNAPITIRAAQLGQVKINLTSSEGFHIKAPYWVFENLEIEGQCKKNKHGYCNHAFHVVGNGHSFVLRNNIITNFNAPLKVNSSDINGKTIYPNYGLVEKNSIYNTMARHTNQPVNLININSANHWVVRGNLISDFAKKSGSNRVSFGAYMKGNSHYGLFENNLVICEHTIAADLGTRIGLSFGGGGTGPRYCRDKDCTNEHSNGIMRNNVILNCSHDVGIYLNKAKNTEIYNNLVFNSLGIDVRFSSSTAKIYNNIISGRIKTRDNASYTEKNNIIDLDCISPSREFYGCSFIDWYWDIIKADLELREQVNTILEKGLQTNNMKTDFCNNPRTNTVDIGPIQYSNHLICSPDRMYR